MLLYPAKTPLCFFLFHTFPGSWDFFPLTCGILSSFCCFSLFFFFMIPFFSQLKQSSLSLCGRKAHDSRSWPGAFQLFTTILLHDVSPSKVFSIIIIISSSDIIPFFFPFCGVVSCSLHCCFLFPYPTHLEQRGFHSLSGTKRSTLSYLSFSFLLSPPFTSECVARWEQKSRGQLTIAHRIGGRLNEGIILFFVSFSFLDKSCERQEKREMKNAGRMPFLKPTNLILMLFHFS